VSSATVVRARGGRGLRWRRATGSLRLAVVTAVAAGVLVAPSTSAQDLRPAAAAADGRRQIESGFSPSDLLWADRAEVIRSLDFMQSIGSRWLRVPIAWSAIENTPGARSWAQTDLIVSEARARGISVLGVIHSTPAWAAVGGQAHSGMPTSPALFGQFAGDVAARYRGKVAALEIWNEPNGAAAFVPMSPAPYVSLLKAAYPRIKAAAPGITVIGGAVGAVVDSAATYDAVRFVSGMYASGAKGYFDALSYHPYQYEMRFSDGIGQANTPVEQVVAIRRSMLANGDSAKRIWATEYGVPTSVQSETSQAAMIHDFHTAWAALPYTGPSMLYTLRDRQTGSSHPEDTFGVITSSWTFKMSAYQVYSDFLNGVEDNAGTRQWAQHATP